MRKQNTQILVLFTLICSLGLFAQERAQDTLTPGVINVIKPYAPTISDAFKVKETPSLDDAETKTKKAIQYNIFSFPVASTFTPAKGKAAVVDKTEKARLFDNYATLGVGTYTTIIGEVYLNHELNSGENLSAHVGHHSSGGGIDGLLVDDNFIDSKIGLGYAKRENNYDWNIGGGYGLQSFNWYGLQQPLFNQATADGLDVGHRFNNAHISGGITIQDHFFKSANVLFRRFGDNQGSGENRFTSKVIFDAPVRDELVSFAVDLDYLSGKFDSAYLSDEALNYSNLKLGVSPSYELKEDNLSVNLGASITYLKAIETGKDKFYIYPNITASYGLLNDVVIVFGGVTGELHQNSYYDFAQENPFVSPNVLVKPTDKQYDSYLGLKGKLSNTIGYKIKGSYTSEKEKPLYINNTITATGESYTYGNSFGVVYDDVTTTSISGEISVDVNRNFTMLLKAAYNHYDTKLEVRDWNLPDVTGSLFLDYQISKHWFAGANLFYAGARKDLLNASSQNPSAYTIVNLESYFDANAHLGYHVNDRWSVFVKGNNLAGESYNKWQNTPVQGIQFLAGATYKFDF